jgi:hypothetical protein
MFFFRFLTKFRIFNKHFDAVQKVIATVATAHVDALAERNGGESAARCAHWRHLNFLKIF